MRNRSRMMPPVSIEAQFVGVSDRYGEQNYGARQKYRNSPHVVTNKPFSAYQPYLPASQPILQTVYLQLVKENACHSPPECAKTFSGYPDTRLVRPITEPKVNF